MKIFFFLVFIIGLGSLTSCKKEPDQPFTLVSLTASGVDVNNSNQVPVDGIITALFSINVNPASVTNLNITMTRTYDGAAIPLYLIIAKNEITITPVPGYTSGTSYSLNFLAGIESSQGSMLPPLSFNFKTAGTFVPSGQVAYWNFESSTADVLGRFKLASGLDEIGIKYVPSKNEESGMAASFNGTTSVLQFPSGSSLLGANFTVSFWMQLNDDGSVGADGKRKGSFVMGIGNYHGLSFQVDTAYNWCRFLESIVVSDSTSLSGTSAISNNFQFFANGQTKDNVGSSPDPSVRAGIDNATLVNQNFGQAGIASRFDNVWTSVAIAVKDSLRSFYINGQLMYQQDLSLLNKSNPNVSPSLYPLSNILRVDFSPDVLDPPTYDDYLVFGFWQSTTSTFGSAQEVYSNPDAYHFKGLLDDIRFFNRSLTDQEIQSMYNDEKP
jgi:Bacterial Ig-like domain